MSQSVSNGHYFDPGSQMLYSVRDARVNAYGCDSSPNGTVSTERRHIFSVDADAGMGTIWWCFGKVTRQSPELARRFVAAVRRGDFGPPLSITEDFYSWVSFDAIVWKEIKGYMDTIIDLTTNPDRPVPVYGPMEQLNLTSLSRFFSKPG